MVDRDDLVELAPHYAVMLLIAFLVLTALRLAPVELNFWIETVIVVGVLLAYRPLVLRLGRAPSVWEDRHGSG